MSSRFAQSFLRRRGKGERDDDDGVDSRNESRILGARDIGSRFPECNCGSGARRNGDRERTGKYSTLFLVQNQLAAYMGEGFMT